MRPADAQGSDRGGSDDDLPAVSEATAAAPVRRAGIPATITPEQLERVIRRASDLQFRSSSSAGSTLDPTEVVRIGEEVGIDPRYVKQALAEVQAEALIPSPPEDEGLARRLVGPSQVRASRVVPGEPADVDLNLGSYLRERELLNQVRSKPGRSLWEPAGGLVNTTRRAMDVGGHGYPLAKARSLQVAVEGLEDGFSLVTLTADVGNVRSQHLGGWFGALGGTSVVGAIGLVAATGGGLLPVLGAMGIVGGAFGIATAGSRAELRKQRARIELRLQGLLDRLERGERLDEQQEPWHQRLLR